MSIANLRKLAAALASKGKPSGTPGDNGGTFPGQAPGAPGEAPANLSTSKEVPVEAQRPGVTPGAPGTPPKPNPFEAASKKAKERLRAK